MALPSFPSVDGASRPSLGGSLVINKPTGVVQGDWMICFIICSANTVITAPGGWTTDGTAAGIRAYRLQAGASEGSSYTFTRASDIGNTIMGVIVRVVNAHATTPVDVLAMQAGGSGTTVVLPSLTVTSGVTLLQIAEVLAAAGGFTPPSGPTELFDAAYATQSFRAAVGSELTVPGATGTRTWTSDTSGSRSGVMYALRGTDETVSPTGIASTAALGSPTVTQYQPIDPPGIASTAVVGTPQLNQQITANEIASTTTVGALTLASVLDPTGIASTSAVGTPTLHQTVTPTGIAPTTAFGTPTVTHYLPIDPPGIASTSAVGTPRLDQTITAAGIGSTTQVGTPTLATQIAPTGIASTSAVGTPTLVITTFVSPSGLASTVTFGTPRLDQLITLAGIAATTALGSPMLYTEVTTPADPKATLASTTLQASLRTTDMKKAVLL